MERISIIVPCYNESQNLDCLCDAFDMIIAQMPQIHFDVLFVDDGSTDDTLVRLRSLAQQAEHIRYLSFSRNFGKEAAILAGLENSSGEYVVIMDADMQDPPSLLPAMYDMLKREQLDCVATRRSTRKGEPMIRSFFARLFYRLNNRFSDVQIVDGARDFRIMSRRMADSIASLKERNRFSKGLFAWVGYRTQTISYENIDRQKGKSKWSFWRLFLYSIEGLVSFSTAPLLLISLIGALICLGAFIMIVYFVLQKLLGGIDVTGYAAQICIILFLGGMQMLSIGILGQYLARIFIETKERPHYIVAEQSGDAQKDQGLP